MATVDNIMVLARVSLQACNARSGQTLTQYFSLSLSLSLPLSLSLSLSLALSVGVRRVSECLHVSICCITYRLFHRRICAGTAKIQY
jgi:hypothetical protein